MDRDLVRNSTILIVDDTHANVEILLKQLSQEGFKLLVAEDGESALEQVQYAQPDLILLDILMPGINGFETCRRLKANPRTADIPVIFMTALAETSHKVQGFEVGAVDYITKPIQHEEVLARVLTHLTIQRLQRDLREINEQLEQRVEQRTSELTRANKALEAEVAERKRAEKALREALTEIEELKNRLQAENVYLQEEIRLNHNFERIIYQSDVFRNVLRKVEQVAPTDATVLILGETGTGKELIARSIHDVGHRRGRPLVKVNCAALPANLIESELFGHEKGTFTGAIARKIGRFELADGGTIFLDEVGDLPLELQSKLLRVLQEGEFERLGNPHTIQVDVRVIAATNRDLKEAMEAGDFREDLYYRLNVFPISLPPLRDRLDDIPLLVTHFVQKFSQKMGRDIKTIPGHVIRSLQSYDWPGNVRELENVIERAVILSTDGVLHLEDLVVPANTMKPLPPMSDSLADVEREHILSVLNEVNWIIGGKRGAARRLQLAPSTLRDRMKKLGIQRPDSDD